MANEIFSLNNYGYIQVNIKEIMDERHISRNFLARAINTRFEVINKWYHGNVEKIDADILARICYVLECTPADIIQYKKPKTNN